MKVSCSLAALAVVFWVLSFAFHVIGVEVIERALWAVGALAVAVAGLVFFASIAAWFFRH